MAETQNTNFHFEAGELLLIDKPREWTSFDVVNKLRYALRSVTGNKKIKVGHSGTLDPLATGLLIIATGKCTKQLQDLQGLDKTYEGVMTLGATTPSYDAEIPVDQTFALTGFNAEMIRNATARFTGAIEQRPPVFSAVKWGGAPAYKRARKGKPLDLAARKVVIHRFEITSIRLPEVTFIVECSKGTYIRSLVHDFGKALNNGAYLSALRRTRIGPHRVEDAWSLAELVSFLKNATPNSGKANDNKN